MDKSDDILKREEAMSWWNETDWTEKGHLMEGEFKHRHPQSLTGREIQKLYEACHCTLSKCIPEDLLCPDSYKTDFKQFYNLGDV